jgi:DNA-directed RNA polymerase alpha subunit
MDIQIKDKSFTRELFNSRYEFEIFGKNVDHVIANTLRRTILSEIPTFIFNDIEITDNTSIYNNNQLKLFLQNIPVVGIKNIPAKYKKKSSDDTTKDIIDDDEQNIEELIGNNEAEIETETEYVDLNILETMTLYLEYHNMTNEIYSVTTNDAKFYYLGKEIKSPYPNPVIIIKLQPQQKIKLTANSVIGIEKEDGKFSCVSICAFNQITDNKFLFFLESRGQLDEKEIVKRACY